jgi:hypothetical protein
LSVRLSAGCYRRRCARPAGTLSRGAGVRAEEAKVSTRIDDPRVQVAVELPSDPESPGYAELSGIGSGEGRPGMDELAGRPWLDQDAHRRGTRLVTVGLRMYSGHPELELNNLPTMFLESGLRLMKELAGYVLAGGELEDDDVMQMRDSLPCLVGFRRIAGETSDDEIVRVIFLS